MKLIERTAYLSEMLELADTPDIKVITGVRRSGKSKLLEALAQKISERQPDANIIRINYNLTDFEDILDYRSMEHTWRSATCRPAELPFHRRGADVRVLREGDKQPARREKYSIFVTGSNASAIALVSLCEALFACVALAAGFLRDREFYQQLDLFCDSPENARCLSSILDEPRTLEGSIAYRALAVQGKAASDELTARSRDMKEYRNYIELWVHEPKRHCVGAASVGKLHGPEIGKVRGDLDRIESRVEQALYYARSATLSEDFSIEELHLAASRAKRAANGLACSSAQGLARVRHRRDARSARRCEMDRLHHRPGPGELGEVRREDHPVRRYGEGCGHERRLHRAADRRRRRRHPRCRCAARVRPRLHGKPGPHASQGNGHGAAPSRRCLRKNGPWPAHFLRRWDGHHRRADLPPRPHAHGSGGILAGAHCKPRSARALPVGATATNLTTS